HTHTHTHTHTHRASLLLTQVAAHMHMRANACTCSRIIPHAGKHTHTHRELNTHVDRLVTSSLDCPHSTGPPWRCNPRYCLGLTTLRALCVSSEARCLVQWS